MDSVIDTSLKLRLFFTDLFVRAFLADFLRTDYQRLTVERDDSDWKSVIDDHTDA